MNTIVELKAKLASVTEEAEYDKIHAQIVAVEKAAILQANREAKEAMDRANAEHVTRLAAYSKKVENHKREKAKLTKEDNDIFVELQLLFDRFTTRYQAEIKLHELAEEINKEAISLATPAVEQRPITIVNWNCHQAVNVFDAFLMVIKQYANAGGHLTDAKRTGRPAPDKPGMSWYHKGNGSYWPGKNGTQ